MGNGATWAVTTTTWTLPREGPGSPARPPERAGSKAGRGSPAATPGLGKSGPHWGWASSPKLSEGEKPGQEGGNKGEEMTG